MAVDRNAASLIALDAVVLDTETTGLDPRTARIVEIAAVRLVNGRLDTGAPFRQPGSAWRADTRLRDPHTRNRCGGRSGGAHLCGGVDRILQSIAAEQF